MLERALPAVIVLLSAGASAVYFHSGDWRKGLYWAAAAVIGLSTIL